jgi:hypothetical protein
MYYTFQCTYCRRAFYTYDRNRVTASVTLYRAVKKHLIDYNEDHKEHELDDGEQEDSNQIYDEMTESDHPPEGGIKAEQLSADSIQPQEVEEENPKPAHTADDPKHTEKNTTSESSNLHPTHSSAFVFKVSLILLLLLTIIIMACIIFIPAVRENIAIFIP